MIAGYELEQALKSAASLIAQAMPCRHQWNEPEGVTVVGEVYSTITAQRCGLCNMIRPIWEQGKK